MERYHDEYLCVATVIQRQIHILFHIFIFGFQNKLFLQYNVYVALETTKCENFAIKPKNMHETGTENVFHFKLPPN